MNLSQRQAWFAWIVWVGYLTQTHHQRDEPCHDESVVETLIAETRRSVNGDLVSRTEVIDHLLDIRLAATDLPLVVATADRLLAMVPGERTVWTTWWLAALSDLERSALDVAVPAGGWPVPPSVYNHPGI